jgi:cytochrome b561
MTIKNTADAYGSIAKFFHWLVFLLVLGLVIVGFSADSFSDVIKRPLINIHKIIGLTVLLLTCLRLLWALINPKPALPTDIPRWQYFAAYLVHGLLYAVLFVMALSGWIMSTAAGHPPNFFGYPLPFPGIVESKTISSFAWNIHSTAAWILIALVALHVLAALKHHFINKDNVLRRMWIS